MLILSDRAPPGGYAPPARRNLEFSRAGSFNTTKIQIDKVNDIPLFMTSFGEASGLPESDPNIIFIVSLLVRQAVPERQDLYSPGELLRDDSGQPIGCIGLSR